MTEPSLLSGYISLKEALRIIDESIANQQKAMDELQASLLTLKSRRNSLVPISYLPPEILCKIFSFSQVLFLNLAGYNHLALEWINLTHVCRHWRNVALNSPSLWTELPVRNRKWVDEMLRRSKESSLVINVDRPHLDFPPESGLNRALKQAHRVRELSILHIRSDLWHTLQSKTLQRFAPQLESFCLVGADDGVQPEDFPIVGNILCDLKRLRRLELVNCLLDWNSNLLCSLTHLKLHNLERDSMPDGLYFVDILANMPELEVLDLFNSLPSEAEQESSRRAGIVHFAHLRTLSIHDSMIAEVEDLFRYITFPPTAMVRVACHHDYESDDSNEDFFGVIMGLARSYSNPTLDTTFQNLILRRARPHGWGVQLKLFTEVLKDFELFDYVDATANLELEFYSADYPDTSVTEVLCTVFSSGIHLDDITHVLLAEEIPGLMPETMANTLGQLPRVHSVVAEGDGARCFLNAMDLGRRSHSSDAAEPSGNSVQTPSFPSLSLIYLYDVTFVEAHLLERPEYSNKYKLSIKLLQDVLMRRCELGLAIGTLVLTDCSGVFEEDIQALEKLLADVKWCTFESVGENEDSEDEESEGEGEEEDTEEDEA